MRVYVCVGGSSSIVIQVRIFSRIIPKMFDVQPSVTTLVVVLSYTKQPLAFKGHFTPSIDWLFKTGLTVSFTMVRITDGQKELFTYTLPILIMKN